MTACQDNGEGHDVSLDLMDHEMNQAMRTVQRLSPPQTAQCRCSSQVYKGETSPGLPEERCTVLDGRNCVEYVDPFRGGNTFWYLPLVCVLLVLPLDSGGHDQQPLGIAIGLLAPSLLVAIDVLGWALPTAWGTAV